MTSQALDVDADHFKELFWLLYPGGLGVCGARKLVFLP
jgi:hypothetical protein